MFFIFAKIFAETSDQEPTSLIIGTTSGYAPYVSLNSQREYEGFDIDIAELLAKKLNYKLALKDLLLKYFYLISIQSKKFN